MPNMNQWIGVGNLTRQPEIRSVTGGSQVAVLGVAVNNNFKRGDQWEQETAFVDVETWHNIDTIAQMSKGTPVLIEGRLAQDQWEDRQTGQKRSKHKIIARRIQSLAPRNAGNQAPPPPQQPQGYQPPPNSGYAPPPPPQAPPQAPPPPRPAGQQAPPPPQFPPPQNDDVRF